MKKIGKNPGTWSWIRLKEKKNNNGFHFKLKQIKLLEDNIIRANTSKKEYCCLVIKKITNLLLY